MSINKSVVYLNDEQSVVTIYIEGREEQINIYKDGQISIGTETSGKNYNLFKEDSTQQSASLVDAGWNEFSKIERYLEALIRVASVQGHKVHDEINDAVKKLKELAYA